MNTRIQSPSEILTCRLSVIAAALTALYCFSNNFIDNDCWGHIFFGREILHNGALLPTATHAYLTDANWINHEWLFQLFVAYVEQAIGLTGLNVMKIAIGFLIVWRSFLSPNSRHVLPNMILVAIVSFNLKDSMVFRPQLATMLFLVVQDSIWRRIELDSGKTSFALSMLLALLFAVWANCHGGFVLGLAILVILSLESVAVHNARGFRTISLMVICWLSTLLTPFGLSMYTELLPSTLLTPLPEINEWNPVGFSDLSEFFAFLVLAAVVAVLILADKRRYLEHLGTSRLLILVCVALQAFLHRRHVAIFALLTCVWCPRLSAEDVPLLGKFLESNDGRLATNVSLATLIGVLVVACSVNTTAFPVDGGIYPIDAAEFMQRHRLAGKSVVPYDWAQYLIAAVPGISVPCDGRFRNCYPQHVIDTCFDFELGHHSKRFRSEHSGPIDGTKLLRDERPETVLLMRSNNVAHQHFQAVAEEWSLLYQDQLAQLWGRRSIFDEEASSRYLPNSERIISDTVPNSWMQWPANARFAMEY